MKNACFTAHQPSWPSAEERTRHLRELIEATGPEAFKRLYLNQPVC